jgi:hypothetical protein
VTLACNPPSSHGAIAVHVSSLLRDGSSKPCGLAASGGEALGVLQAPAPAGAVVVEYPLKLQIQRRAVSVAPVCLAAQLCPKLHQPQSARNTSSRPCGRPAWDDSKRLVRVFIPQDSCASGRRSVTQCAATHSSRFH